MEEKIKSFGAFLFSLFFPPLYHLTVFRSYTIKPNPIPNRTLPKELSSCKCPRI